MIVCFNFLVAMRKHFESGLVLLIDGPHDARRVSGFSLRGRLECEGGEYLPVLSADPMCLYWVQNPIVVEMH
jgi:hypothetical protein